MPPTRSCMIISPSERSLGEASSALRSSAQTKRQVKSLRASLSRSRRSSASKATVPCIYVAPPVNHPASHDLFLMSFMQDACRSRGCSSRNCHHAPLGWDGEYCCPQGKQRAFSNTHLRTVFACGAILLCAFAIRSAMKPLCIIEHCKPFVHRAHTRMLATSTSSWRFATAASCSIALSSSCAPFHCPNFASIPMQL